MGDRFERFFQLGLDLLHAGHHAMDAVDQYRAAIAAMAARIPAGKEQVGGQKADQDHPVPFAQAAEQAQKHQQEAHAHHDEGVHRDGAALA